MPTTLDPRKVEDAIREDIARQGATAIPNISCPAGRSTAPGSKFDCSGSDDEGHSVVTHVWMDGTKFRWKVEGKLVTEDVIGHEIEKDIGRGADVRCPAKTVVLDVGQSFTCDVVMSGRTSKVKITLRALPAWFAWEGIKKA
jgi:hypothetical protein